LPTGKIGKKIGEKTAAVNERAPATEGIAGALSFTGPASDRGVMYWLAGTYSCKNFMTALIIRCREVVADL
jgi:hypothetical protein